MGLFGNTRGQARYSTELHNLQITESVFGTSAPIIFGTQRVALKLGFYGGFTATPAPSGGKGLGGGKSNQQYDYFADILGFLASGSAAGGCRGILNVWDQQGKLENQTQLYSFTITSSTPVTVPSGDALVVDLGVYTLVPYSQIYSDYGGGSGTLSGNQQIAFVNTTGTPVSGEYYFNPVTGQYTFAAADVGKTAYISYSTVFSLYYFETTQAAEVPLTGPYTISTTNEAYFNTDLGVVRVDTGAALLPGTDYTETAGVYTFNSALAGVYVYITYSFYSSDSDLTNTSSLNISFFTGALGQSPWAYMQSKYPGSAFGYTGLCYIGANSMALGESATTPCYNYEVVGLNIFPGGGLDAHPCDAFRTLLYDAFLGVGFPSANVDAWTSCYAYWAANGYLISKTLDTQTSVSDALTEIIETGNVGAVWSGGLLKLVPYGDATVVGNGYTYTPATTPVATLTWNDLLTPSEKHAGETGSDDPLQVAQKAPQDCWNYVQAQWCNRSNDYNNELINEQNDAFIAQYGRRIESSQTWDWITTAATAAWALNLRLKRQCYIRNTYKFWLPFWFSAIEPMDTIMLPTGEVVRITQVTDGADGRLAIEAEQWKYGSGDVTIYPKQAPSSFQPSVSTALPGDAIPIIVQQTLPQSGNVPGLLQIAATGKSPNWGGCNVYVSLDGLSYGSPIATISAPSAAGLLSAALPSGSDPDITDTLSVDLTLSGSNVELVSVTQLLADKLATLCAIIDQNGLNSELMAYGTATLTAAGRYNLTYLRRGCYASGAAAHAAGSWFAFLGPEYKFANYQYPAHLYGSPVYIKLQSFNLLGGQLENLATCQVWSCLLGLHGADITETYVPSANDGGQGGYFVGGSFSSTLSVSGLVSNLAEAYDKNLATSASISSGATSGGTANQVIVNFSGFGTGLTTEDMTLYLNYSNLVLPSQYSEIQILYTLDGSGFMGLLNLGMGASIPSEGTVAASIPAGTNLADVKVRVIITSNGTFGATSATCASASIQVNEMWFQ